MPRFGCSAFQVVKVLYIVSSWRCHIDMITPLNFLYSHSVLWWQCRRFRRSNTLLLWAIARIGDVLVVTWTELTFWPFVNTGNQNTLPLYHSQCKFSITSSPLCVDSKGDTEPTLTDQIMGESNLTVLKSFTWIPNLSILALKRGNDPPLTDWSIDESENNNMPVLTLVF